MNRSDEKIVENDMVKSEEKSVIEKSKLSIGRLLMITGGALILVAVLLLLYNQWDDHRAGQESEIIAKTLIDTMSDSNMKVNMLNVQHDDGEETQSVIELDGEYYIGLLSIPVLNRVLPVQSNWSESKLKHSPCRYSGSLSEGELVIAAHNYSRHFGGLKNLSIGESVVFIDLDGTQYHYNVAELLTTEATDIEGMMESDYELTLFTCNYGGKARLTVRCTLDSITPA